MDDLVLHFLADKLTEDINIEKERINLGKTIWADYELEDLGEDIVFVNLYAEINIDDLKEFSYSIDAGVHYVLDEIEETLRDDATKVIKYAFAKEKTLEGYDPLVKKHDDLDIHTEFSKEKRQFIVDINVMAKIDGGQE